MTASSYLDAMAVMRGITFKLTLDYRLVKRGVHGPGLGNPDKHVLVLFAVVLFVGFV